MTAKWTKRGYLLRAKHAQLPVWSKFGNRSLLVHSERDDLGRSFGVVGELYFDNGLLKYKKLKDNFIGFGPVGTCDVAGAMPMKIINGYLFYIGWTTRKDVPYFNYTCVGKIQDDFNVRKIGPILPPNVIDAGFSGTFEVIYCEKSNCYFGYYLSSTDWTEDENGELQPQYNIKLAYSKNLLEWKKTGQTVIELVEGEAGISSASIYIGDDGVWRMWFSVREAKFFRGGAGSYKIKYAHSTDGIFWTRTAEYQLVAERELDENMAAYPNIIPFGEKIYLLYNGKSFGEGGIKYATLKIADLAA